MNAEIKRPNRIHKTMGRVNEKPMKRREAFTLIELLVAITIFVILTILTLGAFNLNIGSERVRSASRQIQAMLEGAKTRAFKYQKPVGVRFILDEDFPGEISGMMYVTGQSNPAGGSYETGSLRYIDTNGDTTTAEAIQFANVSGNTGISWSALKNRGQIQAGVKIRIPAKTGKWYTVSSVNFLNDTNQSIMQLTEALLDVTYAAPAGANYTQRAKPVTYELDLSTVMGPLSGEEPVSLPKGIIIDLKSSKVPRNWNVNRWIPGKQYAVGDWVVGISSAGLRVFRAENAGFAGNSLDDEPAWPQVVNTSVIGVGAPAITWRCFEVPRFDIVFTPQGTVMGPVVAEGLLHFTLAETRDTRAIFENDPTTTPAGQTTIGVPVWDLRDHDGDGDKPEHIGSFRVITIFPASGSVNVSPVDQTDVRNNSTGAATPDDFADSIFRYAIEGATAK